VLKGISLVREYEGSLRHPSSRRRNKCLQTSPKRPLSTDRFWRILLQKSVEMDDEP
jgi:hypothetical protein